MSQPFYSASTEMSHVDSIKTVEQIEQILHMETLVVQHQSISAWSQYSSITHKRERIYYSLTA